MGCGSSTDDVRVARLLSELEDSKTKANEQQNLLRFKIEVLVNMLAMEEKKSESVEKRVETLKWLLHSQGVAEQTLTSILLNAEKTDEESRQGLLGSVERSISFRNVGLVDLAGALSRALEEFELYKTDIIPAFAGEDGKVVTSLSNDEFMRQLYTVTEKLSKADIQIIALRFGDGSGFVSIPEFLEFFTTPSQIRMAKSATAAVRMSLDLLQLTADEEYLLQQGDEEEEEDLADQEGSTAGAEGDDADLKIKGLLIPQVMSSHLTGNLDRGVRRLLAMWPVVKKELETAFQMAEKPLEAEEASEEDSAEGQQQAAGTVGERVIDLDAFKTILLEKCGIKSGVLGRAESEGRIVVNRTGKPLPSPVRKSQSVSLADGAVSKSVSSLADSKRPAAAGVKSAQEKKGTTSPASSAAKSAKEAKDSPAGRGMSSSMSQVSGLTLGTTEFSVPPVPVVEPLQSADVDMLSERFELGGCVHYGHVLTYFNELHSALSLSRRKHHSLPPVAAASASPFLISSEWEKLRASAVLKQYAAPVPPPPPTVVPVAAEPKDSKPTPTPAPPVPAETKRKGFDAADYKPNELPPPGVEVVEPSSGFLCCGGGAAKPSTNRPGPLPPVTADAKKAAWEDPDDKGADSGEDKPVSADEKDVSSAEDDLPLKTDKEFSTPSKAKSQAKLTFQPKRVTRQAAEDEEDVHRSGLGSKAKNDSEDEGRRPVRRNHFHRRDGDTTGATSKRRAGLDSASDEENNFNKNNTRGESRWR